MKKMLMVLFALAVAQTGMSQEKKLDFSWPDSARFGGLTLPDSLHFAPWSASNRKTPSLRVKPVVTMTSVVVVEPEHLPKRVTVLNNNTLRVDRWFTISNGQAWNNGSFPDSFLDARTISLPMPR